jgi:hypothetical protein
MKRCDNRHSQFAQERQDVTTGAPAVNAELGRIELRAFRHALHRSSMWYSRFPFGEENTKLQPRRWVWALSGKLFPASKNKLAKPEFREYLPPQMKAGPLNSNSSCQLASQTSLRLQAIQSSPS